FAFANDPVYSVAARALDEEERGKLDAAREEWQKLLKYKSDPENRGWALVAQKYLKELDLEEPQTQELLRRIKAEDRKNPLRGESKEEDLAVQALRAELQDQPKEAGTHWL